MLQFVRPPWAARRLRGDDRLTWMDESGGRVQSPATIELNKHHALN